ncbi:MAG: ABC transporter ATP-binding protein [Pelagibacterium sp. SCN 63-23]|nr:MAG: ABC transporter ATP-binding protein [Pelagibacterium sp. SCN 63-23]
MLKIDNLVSGYGTLPVVRGVSFEVAPGEVLLIGGENGAGKSTLLRTIGGFIDTDGGSVTLNGSDLTRKSPEDRVKSGLRLVLDGHRIFPEMSVFDNLRLGATGAVSKEGFDKSVQEIFAVFPILEEKRKLYGRDLSGGQQQMLALGQAFVARPEVLLCDEPSLGLAQALLPEILNFLRRWADTGTAVVIVEQHVDIARDFADRTVFMQRGELLLDGA